MADISKITLPSGTTYNIKDATARANISALSGALTFLGTTTTAITDGATTSPITIGDSSVTPKAGNVVIYGKSEFVWSATESKWREFGSTGSLKALAFKDSASGSYTPAGGVNQPIFTGTKATISSSFTPAGTVSKPTVTVTPSTSDISLLNASVSGETLSFTPSTSKVVTGIASATVSQPTFTGTAGTATASYTPAGTISKITFTGTGATITVS